MPAQRKHVSEQQAAIEAHDMLHLMCGNDEIQIDALVKAGLEVAQWLSPSPSVTWQAAERQCKRGNNGGSTSYK